MRSRIALVIRKLGALPSRVYRRLNQPGGIDDELMPSAYLAPYKRGSRKVRSLWHLQF
jgi:hypothetical protein